MILSISWFLNSYWKSTILCYLPYNSTVCFALICPSAWYFQTITFTFIVFYPLTLKFSLFFSLAQILILPYYCWIISMRLTFFCNSIFVSVLNLSSLFCLGIFFEPSYKPILPAELATFSFDRLFCSATFISFFGRCQSYRHYKPWYFDILSLFLKGSNRILSYQLEQIIRIL